MPNHDRRKRRPSTAHKYSQHDAAHPPGQELFLHVRSSQSRKMKRPKGAAPQKIAELHRRHHNHGLEQRIVDEGASQRQRLVQPKEQSHTDCRKSLKPVDGHDADEESQKRGGRGPAGRKVLLQ